MNTRTSFLRFLALTLSASTLALAGCATTQDRDGGYANAQQTARAGNIDYTRVAAINRTARMKGVEVVWVNPPYRYD